MRRWRLSRKLWSNLRHQALRGADRRSEIVLGPRDLD
jgi:hypothetical protein